MKAKIKFMKIFKKMPKKMQGNLIYEPEGKKPISLSVIALEIECNTRLGIEMLEEMGFEDDKKKEKEEGLLTTNLKLKRLLWK